MRRMIQHAAALLDRSPDFFKQDVRLYELNRRFLWFIVFRFIVIFSFMALAMAKATILPYVPVSGQTFLILAVVLFMVNIFYWFSYSRAVVRADEKRYQMQVAANVQIQIIFDFTVLGYLAYMCGGIESPLVYFFLFHNVISCLFFRQIVSFMYMILSLAIIFFITLGPVFKIIPTHHFMFPKDAAALYSHWMIYSYQLAGIVAVYFIVWYFASNITDSLKRNEISLQQKIDELIEMDKERTRYMLVTTHELKAPFSSIQSYINVVLDGYAGDISKEIREVLIKIKIRCEKMMRMIIEMLQLANIGSSNAKKEDIEMKKTDVSHEINAIVRRFSDQALDKGVSITIISGDGVEIQVNKEQFDILLNNVLSNSVCYCYPNTEITISVEENDNSVVITVEDKGIGIKKEYLDKVFLEYFRSEKAALMNRNSTGLGLSIAKRIMDVHKGDIWIESEAGVGTKVFMKFPRT